MYAIPPMVHSSQLVADHKRTFRLSDEARGGWDQLARASGATLTALLEAIGQVAARGARPIPEDVLDLAREITEERLSRRHRTPPTA